MLKGRAKSRARLRASLLGLAFFIALPGFADSSSGEVAAAPSPEVSVPIARFTAVELGFYRGAQPDRSGLEALKALGVRTIVNVRTTSWSVNEEAKIARELGFKFISKPIGSFFTPKDETIHELLAYVTDPSLRPIFLHCRHGEDRTGLIVGLYRYFEQNWTAESAYAEMLKHGFHPSLWNLRDYFFERTGWYPPGYEHYELNPAPAVPSPGQDYIP